MYPYIFGQLIFNKVCQDKTMGEKIETNCAVMKGYSHVKIRICLIIHKIR